MTRVLSVLRFIVTQFGTMVVFYALLYGFGLKLAIAGSVGFVVVDGVRRHIQGVGFPKLFVLTSVLTFVFGGIDLMAQTPFMIQYEAVVTSLVVAVSFAYGAQGAKPMLQEIAEQRTKEVFPDRADIRAFFKLLTLFWAGYFLVRAVVYLWIGATLPIELAMEIRPILGTASLLVMFAISFQGKRLFALCQRLGLLPMVDAPAYSLASNVSTS
jgi:intracellular septation protein A